MEFQKTRQKLAFLILDPQVQVVKNSPTAQIVFGAVVSAAVLTGNWGTAAVVAGCWLGSPSSFDAGAMGAERAGEL